MEKLPPRIYFNLSYFLQIYFNEENPFVTEDKSISQAVEKKKEKVNVTCYGFII